MMNDVASKALINVIKFIRNEQHVPTLSLTPVLCPSSSLMKIFINVLSNQEPFPNHTPDWNSS